MSISEEAFWPSFFFCVQPLRGAFFLVCYPTPRPGAGFCVAFRGVIFFFLLRVSRWSTVCHQVPIRCWRWLLARFSEILTRLRFLLTVSCGVVFSFFCVVVLFFFFFLCFFFGFFFCFWCFFFFFFIFFCWGFVFFFFFFFYL